MRTDIHSEKSLKPEDYKVVRYLYTKPPEFFGSVEGFSFDMKRFRQEMKEVRDMLHERGARIHGWWSQCDHCGAHYHHGVLLEHRQTGELITVGWICAEQRFELDNITWERKRMEKVMKQVRNRRSKISKLRHFVAEHRESARTISRLSKKSEFLRSLRYQLNRDGELSECQLEAVSKAAEYQRKREERKAAQDAEPKTPAPEGRVIITGEIVHTKFQESQYGSTFKMLVKCDGFRVWSTVPAAIESEDGNFIELKGRYVEFTATLERSADDKSFAFAKRPSKASLKKVA